MRNNFVLRIIAVAAMICTFNMSYGQLSDLGNLVSSGTTDATKLFQAYLEPLGKGLGASFSGGWYNTAKPHKLGGFDLTLSVNMSITPSSDRSFDLSKIGLTNNSTAVASFSENMAPTFSGKRESGPTITYTEKISGSNNTIASYKTPQGTGLTFFPTPMVQFGLGLIKGTEVMVRYMPTVKIGDFGKLGLWGVGLKHNIDQWIPVIGKVPFLNISVAGGYTKFSTSAALSVTHDDINAPAPTVPYDYSGQEMNLVVQSYTASLLASINVPVVCIYGGLGFISTKTSLDLKGDYPVPVPNASTGAIETNVVTDPLSISITNKVGAVTKPRLNAGIRFKFAVITLNFDYTYAAYSVATAGLGISIR
jgi:hypothetical protein